MSDKSILGDLRKQLEEKDAMREDIILKSRPIIKNSKQAIYALHRNDLKTAKKHLDFAQKSLESLKIHNSFTVGLYNSALQEYSEAISYYNYITKNKLVSNRTLNIDIENYLMGLCDLTGELARRAVFSVVNNNTDEVLKVKEFIELIYKEFLQFDLRNSELRKKSDAIKWNLKKVEEILYDLKIRGKL